MPGRYSSFDIEVPKLDKPFKKASKLANLVASCLMCLFSILNIIMLLIIFTSQSFAVEPEFYNLLPVVDFVSANLHAAPINNIALATNLTCPQNYTLEPLLKWPGTHPGCHCPQTGRLYLGECYETDRYTCLTVDPVAAQDLLIWNNQAYCTLRATDYREKIDGQNCLAGYKTCSDYCVRENQACPITDIRITDIGDSDAADSEVVALDEQRVLVITRDPNDITLFEVSASFYDKPCLQPGYIPRKESGSVYPLLGIPSAEGCGIFGEDSSSAILESLNTTLFLEQNNLTGLESLPFYAENEADSMTHLVTRQRIALTDSDVCQTLNTQNLSVLKELIGSFKKWTIGATIFPMIALAIYLIYLAFLLFDEGLKKFYKRATKRWLSWVLFTVCLVVIIVFNIYISADNVKILKEQEYFAALGALDCFDNSNVSLALAAFALAIPMGSTVIMGYANVMFWASIVLYAAAAIIMIAKVIYKRMD